MSPSASGMLLGSVPVRRYGSPTSAVRRNRSQPFLSSHDAQRFAAAIMTFFGVGMPYRAMRRPGRHPSSGQNRLPERWKPFPDSGPAPWRRCFSLKTTACEAAHRPSGGDVSIARLPSGEAVAASGVKSGGRLFSLDSGQRTLD